MPTRVHHFAGHRSHTDALGAPLRVAHLTDQHVGRVTPVRVQQEAIAAVNATQPDLVALTGDFVCHGLAYLDQLTSLVAALEAPAVAVLGNHDHMAGASAVRDALIRGGAMVLGNAWTTVWLRGEPLQVVGVDDAHTGHADVRAATTGLDPRRATLGLSHIAETADELWAHGVPLVLSGHTHGGQITFGKTSLMSVGGLTGSRYVHGLYGDRQGDGAVYVSAGIGAAVLPLRLGARGQREVSVFELGATPQSLPGGLPEPEAERRPLKGRPPPEWVRRRRARRVKP